MRSTDPVNLLYPFEVEVAGPREAGSAAEHLLEILEAGLVDAADGRHGIVLRRPFGLELARPLDSAALAASGIAHFERCGVVGHRQRPGDDGVGIAPLLVVEFGRAACRERVCQYV